MGLCNDFRIERGIMVSKIKLIRSVSKQRPDLKFDLKVVRINGEMRGCSGFITDPHTNIILYVNTEECIKGKILARYARSTEDFTGGINNFVDANNYVSEILKMLDESQKFWAFKK